MNKNGRRKMLGSAVGLIIAVFALALVPAVLADVETPSATSTAVIQTTGPNADLNIGDYRTNAPPAVDGDAGDGLSHRLSVEIPCTPDAVYTFALNSPSLDEDHSTAMIDEIRGVTTDNTTYVLYGPAGGTLQTTTYVPDSADGWDSFATITLPAAPVEGTHCGTYMLQVSTSDDDDNAWRLAIVGDDDGSGSSFASELGPDGIAGTGDEVVIGIRDLSYQHYALGCQEFYWFVDHYAPTNFEMYMLNFDLDNNISVRYFDPDGSVYTGTVSGFTVWNDAAPQQESRPTYADMDPINPPGDMSGDRILNPNTGIWHSEICLGTDNQYSFEVPGKVVYLNEPEVPDVSIEKDDGETTVDIGDTLTYTLTLTNNGLGAALPLPGSAVELTDTISSDTTFVSCTVDAPLTGTCGETAPGSGVIEANLTGNTNYPLAILPGVGSAPDNTGTLTVEVTVDAVAGGTNLVNTATFDFSDIYGNNHAPVSADDTDQVRSPEFDIEMSKAVGSTTARAGDTLTYTLVLENTGRSDAYNVTARDDTLVTGSGQYSSVTVVSIPPGTTYDTAAGLWDLSGIVVGAGAVYTLEIDAVIDPGATFPITNAAYADSYEDALGSEVDADSDPGLPVGEDDEASVTVAEAGTVPPPPGSSGRGSSGSSSSGGAAASVAAAAGSSSTGLEVQTGDPVLVKRGEPENAILGESVRWTITIKNTGTTPLADQVISDRVPSMFEVTGASASKGTVTVNGNLVMLTIDTLAAGESVTLTIDSVATAVGVPPLTCNTASGPGGSSNSVCPSIFPSGLPLTGGQPPSALRWGWIGAAVLAIAAAGWWIGRLASRRRHSLLH